MITHSHIDTDRHTDRRTHRQDRVHNQPPLYGWLAGCSRITFDRCKLALGDIFVCMFVCLSAFLKILASGRFPVAEITLKYLSRSLTMTTANKSWFLLVFRSNYMHIVRALKHETGKGDTGNARRKDRGGKRESWKRRTVRLMESQPYIKGER